MKKKCVHVLTICNSVTYEMYIWTIVSILISLIVNNKKMKMLKNVSIWRLEKIIQNFRKIIQI